MTNQSIILDLIFPKICYGCHQSGDYLCQNCLDKLSIQSIKNNPKTPFEGSLNIFKYDSFLKTILTELKYSFVTDISQKLGDIVSTYLQKHFPHLVDYWLKKNFVLVPVPLHPLRFNWRGFNQSELIGQKIACNLGLHFNNAVFIRHRHTLPQVKIKDKFLRHHNLENAFNLNSSIVPPKNIILFDDVSTTFSTLTSIAKALPKSNYWALTIAG